MTRNQIIGPVFPECPVRNVLGRLCDKWTLLVLRALEIEDHTLRCKEPHKSIGDISQKMLSVTLHELEADGFVMRKSIFRSAAPCGILSHRQSSVISATHAPTSRMST